jgi:cytochrome c-type biogenesis protein CcmH
MQGALLVLMLVAGSPSDAVLEQRVRALSQQLRCLVCQNESLADSQADLAADLRTQIREQMMAGRSDSQITTFLTDRYGDFVLYRPRVKPQTYTLWFGPFVLLGLGCFALFRFLKRWPSLKVSTVSAKDRRRATELLRIGNDPNVNVYREQLAEMEADLRSGLMPREQFDRDREELDRRVLEDCRNTG